MKTYILYTTSKSKKVQEQADVFAQAISQTKGRGEVKIDVQYKRPKFSVPTVDGVLSWSWFRQEFPREYNSIVYDGVIYHFLRSQKKRWGLTANGKKHTENKDYPEFWFSADIDQMAEGYEDLTEFLRLLYHEHGHFDEDLDDSVGNVLTQDSVHKVDYELKQIQYYHLLIDYRGQALKEKVQQFLLSVMRLAKKII